MASTYMEVNAMPDSSAPTTLYRLYDGEDALLYVGIAGNPGRRFEQHRKDKPWWGSVGAVRLEHFDTREEAMAAELDAIRTEHPRHNIVGRSLRPTNCPGVGRRAYSHSGGPIGPARYHCIDAWGHDRSTDELALVWEIDYAAVSDDYLEGDDDPHDVFARWERSVSAKYDTWVPIYWFIDGFNTFESAPFQHHLLFDHDFLSFFTWPTDGDGNPVNWVALPTDHAKSWFFSAATGWTPAPYQPSVNLDMLRMAERAQRGIETWRPPLAGDEHRRRRVHHRAA